MLGDQRHLFALPDDVTYLNCAYLAAQLRSVTEAGLAAARAKERPYELTPAMFFSGSERLRETFATLLGADADGVAFVPAVSYGVAVAAANLSRRDRATLVLADDFPSDVYAWRGAGPVVTVERPKDDDWTAAVLDRLDESVGVVAVPNVHWTDGGLVDLVRVGEAAREVGAYLVVDATQSLGALPLDVARARPDFLVAAGYKWLLGPYALGYLWVAPEHRAGVPIEANWINRARSDDFTSLMDYTDEFQPGARRYDVGERSNFVLTPMAQAALDQIVAWGTANIAAYAATLTARIAAGARSLGLSVAPDHLRAPHLMGVRFPDGLPAGLPERLAAQRIFVSVRGDSVRVSPHVWNTAADCDRLLDALAG